MFFFQRPWPWASWPCYQGVLQLGVWNRRLPWPFKGLQKSCRARTTCSTVTWVFLSGYKWCIYSAKTHAIRLVNWLPSGYDWHSHALCMDDICDNIEDDHGGIPFLNWEAVCQDESDARIKCALNGKLVRLIVFALFMVICPILTLTNLL